MINADGSVSEWFKEHAWKACVRATVPEVRILSLPPKSRAVERRSLSSGRNEIQNSELALMFLFHDGRSRDVVSTARILEALSTERFHYPLASAKPQKKPSR